MLWMRRLSGFWNKTKTYLFQPNSLDVAHDQLRGECEALEQLLRSLALSTEALRAEQDQFPASRREPGVRVFQDSLSQLAKVGLALRLEGRSLDG